MKIVFENPIMEIIRKRKSTRTYLNEQIEPNKKQIIIDLCNSIDSGLFAEKIKFYLIDKVSSDGEKTKVGSYGSIKNAPNFIIGTIEKSKFSYESYGYMLECIVLKATDIGLDTCWFGAFSQKKIKPNNNEIIPAACAIGIKAEKKAFKENLIQGAANSSNRKPFQELCFLDNIETPAQIDSVGEYYDILEMVRLAPSAGNKQPCIIIKEKNANTFHFYRKSSNIIYEGMSLNKIDIGIAMAHFEVTAKEKNISGSWKELNPSIKAPSNLTYVISWVS